MGDAAGTDAGSPVSKEFGGGAPLFLEKLGVAAAAWLCNRAAMSGSNPATPGAACVAPAVGTPSPGRGPVATAGGVVMDTSGGAL